MTNMRSRIAAAKLKEDTSLYPLLNNANRWSSTFNMLKRYRAIMEFTPYSFQSGVLALNPRNVDDTYIDSFVYHKKSFTQLRRNFNQKKHP